MFRKLKQPLIYKNPLYAKSGIPRICMVKGSEKRASTHISRVFLRDPEGTNGIPVPYGCSRSRSSRVPGSIGMIYYRKPASLLYPIFRREVKPGNTIVYYSTTIQIILLR